MNTVAVSGTIRTELGKKANKAVRKEGRIPAVLYSKDGVTHFTTTHNAVKSLIFTPDFKLAELELDGKKQRCIVKDIQWHPVTDEIVHMDFLSLIDDHAIKIQVPIRFVGTAPGIRAGGKLQQTVRRVKIKTKPENMVAEVVLDISELELGQSIRIRDIAPMEGVEVMNPPGTPVGIVEIPRALRSAATAEKKAAAGGDVEAEA